jgi:glycosyltransferase involved in cell wall biosynthesis
VKPIPKDAIYPHVRTFAARLRRAWTQDRPDVVHSHFWMSGLAALGAAKPLGLPVAHTFHALGVEKRRHQGNADTSPDSRIAEEERIVREVDRVVATASAEVFELLRMGANPRKLKIVPCGVDLDRFTPEGPRETRRADRMRISLARALGVADRVYLRGRVEREDVPPLLRSADVVVCTPWYEPFGIVPLEAMACGVPVVVSSVGGLVDTVVDGLTGIHVPPQSPRQLAYALKELAADAARRRMLGRLGVDRVRARYSWSRIAAETFDIYRGLVTTSKEELALGG